MTSEKRIKHWQDRQKWAKKAAYRIAWKFHTDRDEVEQMLHLELLRGSGTSRAEASVCRELDKARQEKWQYVFKSFDLDTLAQSKHDDESINLLLDDLLNTFAETCNEREWQVIQAVIIEGKGELEIAERFGLEVAELIKIIGNGLRKLKAQIKWSNEETDDG